MNQQEFGIAQYEFELRIARSPQAVWRGLTDQVDQWWLADFHVLGQGSRVHVELEPGGRLMETLGDRGLLWYRVLSFAPSKHLELVGHCSPTWGGPSTTMLTLVLEEVEGGTRLRVSDALYGRISDKQVASVESGWKQLFGDGLKTYLESITSI